MGNKSNSVKSREKWFVLITICIVILLTFISIEMLLRVLPIPGIQFDVAKYDDLIGGGRYPHSVSIYRNAHGDFVKRTINQWGYLDQEHKKNKEEGIYRIGFFGDSYTEARQVPIENTFFVLAENRLKKYDVECLSFGISGLSMLQSFLNSKRWSDFFNLDLIVYVFVENDLGDQIKEIKKSLNIPYAILTKDGFDIDYSFRGKNAYKKKIYFRLCDYITAHSLVVSTLVERIKLLKQYGIKFKVTEEDMLMATKAKVINGQKTVPNQNDLPSTWPASLRTYAENLGSKVLLKWRDEIINQHRDFKIMYVPRASELEKETRKQDSWKPWIESFCKKQNIDFIDPTENLLTSQRAGKQIFYDHFTKEGHSAFADAFVNWFVEIELYSKLVWQKK